MTAPLFRKRFPGKHYPGNINECKEQNTLPQRVKGYFVSCCVICGRVTPRKDENGLPWCAGKLW